MSDYADDDFDDDEWLYAEDEYSPADELAEHAVPSPPPTDFDDEEADVDVYDYFIDLEWGEDYGIDDANFYTHNPQTAQNGQKRKRVANGGSRKKQKLADGLGIEPLHPELQVEPVLWRSRADREAKARVVEEDMEPYALLKDWRERLADTPQWATPNPRTPSEPLPSVPALDDDDDDEEEEEGPTGVDPAVLMEALRNNLAAAGGPLSGLDPQQLLQFAMRMMDNQDAGDDIAGELADDLLAQGQEDDDEEPAELMDWLSKQRVPANDAGPSNGVASALPGVPEVKLANERPPTPPPTDTKDIKRVKKNVVDDGDALKETAPFQLNGALPAKHEASTRKRKAEDDAGVENGEQAPKKRATRSYDAPTAASQARTTARTTRSGRPKRS